MALSGHICRVDECSRQDRDQMFALMRRYYENINRDEFDADLDDKDWVIVARDRTSGDVCGFSTQSCYSQDVGDETVRVLFSGDTIIDQDFWAKNPLARLWGRLALSLMDAQTNERLFWFLITKGYKTYRFLPVFFHEFYPRYDRPTPDWAVQLVSELAAARFGARFSRSTGVLHASAQGCRLRESVADVTTDRLRNPHIAFFEQANPGHREGDELCCVALLTRENFNRNAFRVMGTTPDDRSFSPLEIVAGHHG